jgi:hypothetical protein
VTSKALANADFDRAMRRLVMNNPDELQPKTNGLGEKGGRGWHGAVLQNGAGDSVASFVPAFFEDDRPFFP